MTCTKKPDELLRIDERGRVWVSAERRAALLAEFDRSGMSAAAFARWAGMKYPTLANWLQQRRKAGGAGSRSGHAANEGGAGALPPSLPANPPRTNAEVPESVSLAWAELVVSDPAAAAPKGKPTAPALCVRLPGGASLELDGSRESLRLAAELLRELERVGSNRGGVAC